MVVGGPTSFWPMSASRRATETPASRSLEAAKRQKELLPVSVPPRTRTFRGRAARITERASCQGSGGLLIAFKGKEHTLDVARVWGVFGLGVGELLLGPKEAEVEET